jgi:hypothetical protein
MDQAFAKAVILVIQRRDPDRVSELTPEQPAHLK